jgi:hypothetical protein
MFLPLAVLNQMIMVLHDRHRVMRISWASVVS